MIKVLGKIAQSGMSAVYKAVNEETNKSWAVKKTKKENNDIKQRLAAEKGALKSLRHPNLPSVIDIVDNDDSFVIIMEYIEGTTMNKVIEEHGAQSQNTVMEWAKQLCDVLCYLHSRQPAIICGNMKPSNIMLKSDGNVTLLDFCTLKEYKERHDMDCSQMLAYAAPEQLDVNGQPDERTDIYCLGATLYYLATGCNLNGLTDKIKHGPGIKGGLSREVEKIIIKSIQQNPADRYQSAAEMLDALNNCEEAGGRKRKSLRHLLRGLVGLKEVSESDARAEQKTASETNMKIPYSEPISPSGGMESPQISYAQPSQWSDGDTAMYVPSFDSGCFSEAPPFFQSGNVYLSQVCFSAVVPKRFIKGEYSMIEISVYEEMYRSIVDKIIANADTEVKEVVGGVQNVEQGAMIRIELSSSDMELTDCEETQRWVGKYLIFDFPIDIPNDYAKKQIRFTASVYFNGVIATRLKFIASCTSVREQKLELIREDVFTAFISYAAQDRTEVATIIQGMKKIRPDLDVFFDVDNLRSGEYWETALKREIEERDILYLCWSKFAKESKWVEKEWKYALQNKGLDSIEPVSLVSPTECPPPEELKSKHFNDKALLYKKM